MNVILLSPYDLGAAASLVALDAGLSLVLRLGLHRQIALATVRMIVQLVAVGFLLRIVFRLANPVATVSLVVVMLLIAAREVAARPDTRFKDNSVFWLSAASVTLATGVTAVLALTTAIRPHPWFDPRYAPCRWQASSLESHELRPQISSGCRRFHRICRLPVSLR